MYDHIAILRCEVAKTKSVTLEPTVCELFARPVEVLCVCVLTSPVAIELESIEPCLFYEPQKIRVRLLHPALHHIPRGHVI
jgi:hypothetical protein